VSKRRRKGSWEIHGRGEKIVRGGKVEENNPHRAFRDGFSGSPPSATKSSLSDEQNRRVLNVARKKKQEQDRQSKNRLHLVSNLSRLPVGRMGKVHAPNAAEGKNKQEKGEEDIYIRGRGTILSRGPSSIQKKNSSWLKKEERKSMEPNP